MSNDQLPSNSPEDRPRARVPRASERSEPRIRRPSSRVILLILVLGLMVYEAPREISRWYLAAAEVAFEQDDADAALRYLDSAIAWNKDVLNVYEKEDSWWQGQGNIAIAISDATGSIDNLRNIYAQYPTPKVKYAFVMALNDLAYIRAVAVSSGVLDPKELDAAWNDIEEAFEILDQDRSDAMPNGSLEMMLDTRGYIAFLKGDYESACTYMEAAVTEAEKSQEMSGQNLAVIYHHRGEVYEALGRTDDAARDFERADDLGYVPERIIQ